MISLFSFIFLCGSDWFVFPIMDLLLICVFYFVFLYVYFAWNKKKRKENKK